MQMFVPRPSFRSVRSIRPALMAAWASAVMALSVMTPGHAQGPVVDDLGRTVVLPEAAQRIVAMIPTHTETVCALGACDRLVGVDRFSNYPDEVSSLPALGSAFDADVEAILALEPDLVLVDEYSGLAEALAPLGIPVYAGTPQTVDDIWEVSDELGALLGLRAEAALLIGRTRGRLDALTARASGRVGPTVFVELDATPYSVGPDGYLGSLLSRAGLRNIVPAEAGEFPRIDPERVIASDPDAIVLLDAPFGESLVSLAARPGWAGMTAVRTGAVVEATQDQVDLLTRAGPRVADALELLLHWFEPGDR